MDQAGSETFWLGFQSRFRDPASRNRARYATLLGLDLRPPDPSSNGLEVLVIEARLPWERGEPAILGRPHHHGAGQLDPEGARTITS